MNTSKPSFGSLRLSASLVIRLLTVLAAACYVDSSSTDTCPRWDTDCDGISNAVETESANRRYHFDTTATDYDPTVAQGLPNNGSLSGGLNYPETDEGTYQYRPNPPGNVYYDVRYDQPDSNDWGTNALIRIAEFVGRERDFQFSASPPCDSVSLAYDHIPAARRFAVGDMSKDGGGPWYHTYDGGLRHDSHQNGLDMDIRYLRKDGVEGPLDLATDSWNYDTLATVDLMRCFYITGHVDLIFADSTVLGFWNAPGQNRPFVHDAGHHNHFHVRILHP